MIWNFAHAILAALVDAPAHEKHQKTDVLLWGSILIVAIVVGGAAVAMIRKHLNAPPDGPDTGGFSLADLRGMRDRGELTEQEYVVARAKMIAKVKSAVEGESDAGRKVED